MFKKLAIASALALALSTSTSFAAQETAENTASAKVTSIAVVNLKLIMSELPQAKAEAEALQKEFGPRNEELTKIEEKGRKLEQDLQKAQGEKAVEIQRQLQSLRSEYELKGQAFREDTQKKQREVEVKLLKLVQTAIDRIAKERGIDLVLRGESVVFASDSVDISNEVIARASKLKPASKAKEEKASK